MFIPLWQATTGAMSWLPVRYDMDRFRSSVAVILGEADETVSNCFMSTRIWKKRRKSVEKLLVSNKKQFAITL